MPQNQTQNEVQPLPTRIDELANQVAARLWQLVSTRITARVELEVARTQAKLRAHAAALRHSHGQLGEQIAQRLEQAGERLANGVPVDTDEWNWTIELSVATLGDRPFDESPANHLNTTGGRRRGRPKKTAPSLTDSELAPGTDGMPDTIDEVTNEERTGACDSAGADQVPDLSAEDIER